MSDQLIEHKPHSQLTLFSGSSIQQLPLELLLIVFDLSRRDPPSTTPFTLSHVCPQWRLLLLVSPALWTTIVLQAPFRKIEYYNLWFSRCQDLDLSLHIHSLYPDPSHDKYQNLFNILSGRSRPWQRIQLAGAIIHTQCSLYAIIKWLQADQFSKLKELRMPFFGSPPSLEQGKRYKISPMPNLEWLNIHPRSINLSPRWFSAIRSLRHLQLAYNDVESVPAHLTSLYQIIQHVSSRLEVLWIQIFDQDHPLALETYQDCQSAFIDELPNETISLPELEKLDLSWGDSNSMAYFFTPLLHRLRAPNLDIVDSVPISTLADAGEPYISPKLRHLGLTGHQFDNTAFTEDMIAPFITAFAQLPNLRLVVFHSIIWHRGEFVTAFLSSCPLLVMIRLHSCSDVHEKDLRKLVEGREVSEELASLRLLSVTCCIGLELDEEAQTWFEDHLEIFRFAS